MPESHQLFVRHWKCPADIPKSDLDACYKLVRMIKPMYESSGMGWDAKSKKTEMRMSDLEYYIVYESTGLPRGNANTSFQTSVFTKMITFFSSKSTGDGDIETDANTQNPYKRHKRTNIENEEIDNKSEPDINHGLSNKIKNGTNTGDAKVIAFLSCQPIAAEFINNEEDSNDKEEPLTEVLDTGDKNVSHTDETPKYNPSVTYIYEIHISKNYQRLGLGKQLLNMAKQRCIEEPSSQKLLLTVFNVNKLAQNFYLNNGFSYYKEPGEDSNDKLQKNRADASERGEKTMEKAQLNEKSLSKGLNLSTTTNTKQWHSDLKDFGKTRIKGYHQMEWVKPLESQQDATDS